MIRKSFLILLLIVLLSAGSVFAGGSRHSAGDMLLGINLGMGITTNFSDLLKDNIPADDYGLAFNLGLNFDYYFLDWLSASTGVFATAGMYGLFDKPVNIDNYNLTDYAKTPICFTLPLQTHINIPKAEFLYLGAGLNFNFPTRSIIDSVVKEVDIDTKGKFFLGIPIDFGFDFVQQGSGGSRLFFRVMPEIHKGWGRPVLVGFVWQIYNFLLFSK